MPPPVAATSFQPAWPSSSRRPSGRGGAALCECESSPRRDHPLERRSPAPWSGASQTTGGRTARPVHLRRRCDRLPRTPALTGTPPRGAWISALAGLAAAWHGAAVLAPVPVRLWRPRPPARPTPGRSRPARSTAGPSSGRPDGGGSPAVDQRRPCGPSGRACGLVLSSPWRSGSSRSRGRASPTAQGSPGACRRQPGRRATGSTPRAGMPVERRSQTPAAAEPSGRPRTRCGLASVEPALRRRRVDDRPADPHATASVFELARRRPSAGQLAGAGSSVTCAAGSGSLDVSRSWWAIAIMMHMSPSVVILSVPASP